MTENLKRIIDSKIDTAIRKKIETTDKSDRQKLAELQKKTTELRKVLKDALKKPIEDNLITETEWNEMFDDLQCTCKDLLVLFGIKDVLDLKVFIGIREKISTEKKTALAQSIINAENSYVPLLDFLERQVKILPAADVGEILYMVAMAGKIEFGTAFNYLDYYKESPKFKDILIRAAMNDSYGVAINMYSQYMKYPWAFDILKVVFRSYNASNPEAEVDDLFNRKLITEEQKLQLIDVVKEHRRVRNLAYNIIGKPVLMAATDTELKDKKESLVNNLLLDPALEHLSKLNSDWIKSPVKIEGKAYFIHPADKLSFVVAVVRNLFFKKIELTEESVEQEVERILLIRVKNKNQPIFRGRNVLIMAHLEVKPSVYIQKPNKNLIMNDDKYVFGKSATVETIRRQNAKVEVMRAEDNIESLKKTKAEVLQGIINTPPPFTFVFDGHGSENGIYLSHGQIGAVAGSPEREDCIKITVEELAAAYKKRYVKYPGLKTPLLPSVAQRDILIFASCFNHTFARRFYDLLPADAAKPVIIGTSEYGQYGHSDYGSIYGSCFFERTLALDRSLGNTTTFQEVFWGDRNQGIDNPYVYIPDEMNGADFMQISKRDAEEGVESVSV